MFDENADVAEQAEAHNDTLETPSDLMVCRSAAGYYIGRMLPDGSPYSRDSVQYWTEESTAQYALEHNLWTQRENP